MLQLGGLQFECTSSGMIFSVVGPVFDSEVGLVVSTVVTSVVDSVGGLNA